jgi:hypothetical protein
MRSSSFKALECSAETDSALEGAGFEPSVPREREKERGSTKVAESGSVPGSLAHYGIGLWWTCFFLTWPGEWVNIYFNHFPVTMGIPCAMLGAVIICTLFRTIEGRIKFGGLGFTFEGAAGPIVMWVLCFLAFVTSVRVLWPLTTH